MSNPDQAAAQGQEAGQTFEQQVNNVVGQLTQNDKGLWQLPTDIKVDDSVHYAAMTEKRRRDTESALSKTRQKLKAEEAVRKELEKRVTAPVQLDTATQEALDALKYEDPEAWRQKVNELESTAATALQEELQTITTTAAQQTEQTRRTEVLAQFNAVHKDSPLTDDMLSGDIPPRIVKKLEEGQLTFEDFLVEAHSYVTSAKVVGSSTQLDAQPSLGSAGGGSNSSDAAKAAQDLTDYAHTVF